MFGKVEPEPSVSHNIRNMKIEPVEVIRGGTVTCVFTAAPGSDVDVLIYSILGQHNVDQFSIAADGNIQNFKVNTTPLSAGEYLVKLQSGRDTRNGKFSVV